MLVLDASSAGAEDTVVWNVIGKHRRSRNTCNVKSGRFPVHLGLDHTVGSSDLLHDRPAISNVKAAI